MNNKNVFLFCSGIDDVLSGSSKVSGIQVQMSFWAKTFTMQGWNVFTFTNNSSVVFIEGISFVQSVRSKWFSITRLNLLQEFLNCIRCIRLHPDLVIVRGASRSLFFISKFCNYKKIRILHFGASDTDFQPGCELISGSSVNRVFYQKAIGGIGNIVTQNIKQHDTLLSNYGKESLVLPNLWITSPIGTAMKQFDAIWVANLRPLKRAEWFVDLAKEYSQYRFAIVGGVGVKEYFDLIKKQAESIENLSFLGAKPFEEINLLMAKSRLLVCTSEFEGFPNTFLQAWAQSVPVVSTVNPSGVITQFGLGYVVNDEVELKNAVQKMLMSELLYCKTQENIYSYFNAHHSAIIAYQKVINLVYN